MNTRLKKAIFFFLKGGFVVALIWWLINRQALSWEYFHFTGQSLPWIGLGAGLIFCSIILTGTRYWLILMANGIHLDLSLILRTELAATFFNICSIGPIGGDVVRTYYVSRNSGNPLVVAGCTVVDRMMGLYVLLIVTALTILFCSTEGAPDPILITVKLIVFGVVGGGLCLGLMAALRLFIRTAKTMIIGYCAASVGVSLSLTAPTEESRLLWIVAATVMTAATTIVGILAGGRLEKILTWFENRGVVANHGATLFRAIFIIKDDMGRIFKALILSTIQQTSFILAMFAFGYALPLPVTPSFNDIFFATPMTFIIAIFPLPGAGLGVNEAVFDYLLNMASPALVGGASLYLFYRTWLILISAMGIPFYLSDLKRR